MGELLSSLELVSVGEMLSFVGLLRRIESDEGAFTKGLLRRSIGLNRLSSVLVSSWLASDGGTPITTV